MVTFSRKVLVFWVVAWLIFAVVMLMLVGCSSEPKYTNDCQFYQFPGSYLKYTDEDNGRQVWCRDDAADYWVGISRTVRKW